jgi:hypothetical protein
MPIKRVEDAIKAFYKFVNDKEDFNDYKLEIV